MAILGPSKKREETWKAAELLVMTLAYYSLLDNYFMDRPEEKSQPGPDSAA